MWYTPRIVKFQGLSELKEKKNERAEFISLNIIHSTTDWPMFQHTNCADYAFTLIQFSAQKLLVN